jgi:Phytanoyl-CoA dioxygenase (PhyH)
MTDFPATTKSNSIVLSEDRAPEQQQQTSNNHAQHHTTAVEAETAVVVATTQGVSASSSSSSSVLPLLLLSRKGIVGTSVLLVVAVAAWSCLLGAQFASHWYHSYYHPLVVRLGRTANYDAVAETDSTYYARHCTSYDVTTRDANDLVLRLQDDEEEEEDSMQQQPPLHHPLDSMMVHGVGIVPRVLSKATAAALRHYVLSRNQNATDDDDDGASFPVYPTEHRAAFAMDAATEHASIRAAVRELASHRLLYKTISRLLGDADPAVMEIAAIAVHEGAEPQEWHHDGACVCVRVSASVFLPSGCWHTVFLFGSTNVCLFRFLTFPKTVEPDGMSAVQFGRTYAQTYSLYIALQDTYETMGATKVCPGTHMCAMPQGKMCEHNAILPLTRHHHDNYNRDDDDDNDDDNYDDDAAYWAAGDGLLFNQQLCHRGEAHTGGEARVVFIVSLTARPNLLDSRVLPEGLFTMSLWTTWGLSWKDLSEPATWHMTNKWWRYLRSLGLWRPPNRSWGMDFLTKSLLEWNMGENGMEQSELPRYVRSVQKAIGFPDSWHGEIVVIDEDDEVDERDVNVYHLYIATTLEKFVAMTGKLCAAAVALLLVVSPTVCLATRNDRYRPLEKFVFAAFLLPVLCLVTALWRLRISEWGASIQSRNRFKNPFPSSTMRVSMLRSEIYDNAGPTTTPERNDVLIGTRLLSRHLGGASKWTDFHPGNRVYLDAIDDWHEVFFEYKALPNIFQDAVVDQIMDTARGRLLRQNWLTGRWMILQGDKHCNQVRIDIVRESRRLFFRLGEQLDVLLAKSRFDVSYRESAMGLETQVQLVRLKDSLFLAGRKNATSVKGHGGQNADKGRARSGTAFRPRQLAAVLPVRLANQSAISCANTKTRWTSFPILPHFEIGDPVIAVEDFGIKSRATIIDIFNHGNGPVFSIALESIGHDAHDVPLEHLLPLKMLQSGDAIKCHRSAEFASAVVVEARPDHLVDIKFLIDGKIHRGIDPEKCRWNRGWSEYEDRYPFYAFGGEHTNMRPPVRR